MWASSGTAPMCRAIGCRPAEVARVWTDGTGGLPIKEKAVAGLDEDTLTMSIEAARNALARARIDPPGPAGGLGGQRVAPVRRQAHLHHRGRGHRRDAVHPGRRPGVRLQGGQRGDRRWASASSARGWDAMCWPSAWTRPRAGPAMRWSTPRRPAARPSSSGRPRRAWRSTRRCCRTSPTRRTSGGGPMRTIPATATASRASRPISSTS